MQVKSFFRTKTLVSLVMSSVLVLSGCASTGSSMATHSADTRLKNDSSAKFFNRSGYQACAVAAGVGVLACLVSNSSNKAACAIAVGVAACGVAMGANYYLDDRRSKYANTTQRLQAMTKDVQDDTARVVQRTNVAQRVIVDDKAKLAQIKRDMASKNINVEKAKKDLVGIDQNIAILNSDLKNMQVKVDAYKETAQKERQDGAGNKVVAMEREIARMNQKVASLKAEVDALYNQRSAITLG